MRSPITTHVLDTAIGKPAAGIRVELFAIRDGQTHLISECITDSDGRVTPGLIHADQFKPGIYRIHFAVESYFKRTGTDCFFPEVVITFKVSQDQAHYHVPLLLSPFGYSTYRGS
jgi:5-hydroxyisourate hydrolase